MTRPSASVWWEGPKRGPWKIRWRDGTRTASGNLKKYASHQYTDVLARDAAITAKIAELAQAQAIIRAAAGGRWAIPAIVERYVHHHRATGRIAAAYALEFAHTITALAARNGWIYLDQITADAVESWRSHTANGRGTDKPLAQLKRLARWASGPPVRARIDPDLLRIPPRRRETKAQPALLTTTQLAAILARAREFGPNVETALDHLSRYGCRPNELCRLTVADWNRTTRELTHRRTKNRRPITHTVDPQFATRLDALTAARPPTAPIYLSPLTGQGWKPNKHGKYQSIIEWYRNHITTAINAPADAAAQAQPWQLHGDDRLAADQHGIYCLKDYAIQRMEDLGIDDRTKSTFTAITTLTVYARYKATNRDRNRAAAAQIGAAIEGAHQGARTIYEGTNADTTPTASKNKNEKISQ